MNVGIHPGDHTARDVCEYQPEQSSMKKSTDRILTTHVGSLIRPPKLVEFMRPKQSGQPFDHAAFAACLRESVADVVHKQAEVGIDVVSDGEFGKAISWNQYVLDRLTGFEQRPLPADFKPANVGADRSRFAGFYAELDARDPPANPRQSVCVGKITYRGQDELQRDIDNFKAALKGAKVEEAFMPVVAPASVVPERRNEYYKTNEELVADLAEAMRIEYRMIVDAGFILQVDDARTAVTYDRMVPPGSLADYRKWAGLHMEALNHALDGIPEDRVRYHMCWGSWPGPHATDVPLKDIVDLVLSVRAGAYVLEAGNPRHAHEWKVWQDVKLPDGKLLIPGVISHVTNVVEHPELVAERIVKFARIVGRENVLAGTDCGFAQGTFYQRVHPTVMWAKFEALVEGARLASKHLWS
jgi:5-methyltetrahydropteroyltriglutamate--homocysteine methyltransferase